MDDDLDVTSIRYGLELGHGIVKPYLYESTGVGGVREPLEVEPIPFSALELVASFYAASSPSIVVPEGFFDRIGQEYAQSAGVPYYLIGPLSTEPVPGAFNPATAIARTTINLYRKK